ARITGAKVRLYQSEFDDFIGDIVTLHAIRQPWSEGPSVPSPSTGSLTGQPPSAGDVTWSHRNYPSETWEQPGGDFLAMPSAAALVDRFGFIEWQSAALAEDVQRWLDNPGQHHGWILDTPLGTFRFGSREAAAAEHRPVLTIEYEDDPLPLIADVHISEGSSDPTIRFEVRLDRPISEQSEFHYRTED